jgi:hypothetical protein
MLFLERASSIDAADERMFHPFRRENPLSQRHFVWLQPLKREEERLQGYRDFCIGNVRMEVANLLIA